MSWTPLDRTSMEPELLSEALSGPSEATPSLMSSSEWLLVAPSFLEAHVKPVSSSLAQPRFMDRAAMKPFMGLADLMQHRHATLHGAGQHLTVLPWGTLLSPTSSFRLGSALLPILIMSVLHTIRISGRVLVRH